MSQSLQVITTTKIVSTNYLLFLTSFSHLLLSHTKIMPKAVLTHRSANGGEGKTGRWEDKRIYICSARCDWQNGNHRTEGSAGLYPHAAGWGDGEHTDIPQLFPAGVNQSRSAIETALRCAGECQTCTELRSRGQAGSCICNGCHRIIGCKRPLSWPSPTIHPTPPHLLNHVLKCHIHKVFEPLQGWGLHHCPGQPGPVPDHSCSKEIFPNIQSKHPLMQLEAIDSQKTVRVQPRAKAANWGRSVPRIPGKHACWELPNSCLPHHWLCSGCFQLPGTPQRTGGWGGCAKQ